MKQIDKEVLAVIRMITGAKMMSRTDPARAEQGEIAEYLSMSQKEVYDSCLRLYKAGKIEGKNENGVRWFKAIQLAEELELMNRKI